MPGSSRARWEAWDKRNPRGATSARTKALPGGHVQNPVTGEVVPESSQIGQVVKYNARRVTRTKAELRAAQSPAVKKTIAKAEKKVSQQAAKIRKSGKVPKGMVSVGGAKRTRTKAELRAARGR